MPSRNTIRQDIEQSYYHVYARGASKAPIFLDKADYLFFLSLFRRHLSPLSTPRKQGADYPHLHHEVKLLAYCLMKNHFHMYVYQTKAGGLTQLMRSVMTSYSRYFNTRYKRTGSLFESRFKAAVITTDSYNLHISRYIHMNPRYWQRYPYSSLGYYLGSKRADWLETRLISEKFGSPEAYLQFHKDYEYNKSQLDEIKHYLADW